MITTHVAVHIYHNISGSPLQEFRFIRTTPRRLSQSSRVISLINSTMIINAGHNPSGKGSWNWNTIYTRCTRAEAFTLPYTHTYNTSFLILLLLQLQLLLSTLYA